MSCRPQPAGREASGAGARRRDFLGLLGSAAAALLCVPAWAATEPSSRVRRVGVLLPTSADEPQAQANFNAFTRTLEELGWKDNVRFELRWGAGQSASVKGAARELVGLAPEVILVGGGGPTAAVRDATGTIPVVFVGFTNPVAAGLVETLARPGRNMTGFTSLEFSVGGKWLEILKAVAPQLNRVGAIFNPETAPHGAEFLRLSAAVASALAIELTPVPIGDEAGIRSTIGALGGARGGGLMVLPDPFNSMHKRLIVELAQEHRLPAIYPGRSYAAAGGLLSYGVELAYLYRQAAAYVDRILRGARPGELPVQAPSKFELVVNLRAAESAGVEIPTTLLATADEVIE
ncbi:MAG TPA: ABC transporter substrate-binding protein [Xanthobacteraceae bacterium]